MILLKNHIIPQIPQVDWMNTILAFNEGVVLLLFKVKYNNVIKKRPSKKKITR